MAAVLLGTVNSIFVAGISPAMEKEHMGTYISVHEFRRAQTEAQRERNRVWMVKDKLDTANRILGGLVLEGKIPVPPRRLGELVIQMAEEEQAAETMRALQSQPP